MQRPCALQMAGPWQIPPAQQGCPGVPQGEHVVVMSHAVPLMHQ